MIRDRRSSGSKRCRRGGARGGVREKLSVWALGKVRSQDRNLKKLTEGHHKEWSVRLNLTQRGAAYQGRMCGRLAAARPRDCAGSGAWPFATRGVTCLVNSDNA